MREKDRSTDARYRQASQVEDSNPSPLNSRSGIDVVKGTQKRRLVRKLSILLASLIAVSSAFFAYRYWFSQREPPPNEQLMACMRAYLLGDDRLIWFSTSASQDALRYYFMSGETGMVQLQNDIDDQSLCFAGGSGWAVSTPATVEVTFRDAGKEILWCSEGQTVMGQQVRARITETAFSGAGVTLKGRLIMPETDIPVPIAVMVHGSERSSALWNNRFQYMFPAQGIGVFIYDKRGTGRSSGSYTQNFELLAEDAAAAWKEAQRLSGKRHTEIGYCGGSQAGWVIPLAARKSEPDFLSICYGLAESPLAEDREEVQTTLKSLGYGQTVLQQAKEVTDATALVMASGFLDGYDQVSLVKRKYADQEWYAHVQGEFSGDILYYPHWLVRLIGPQMDVGTPWSYDPLPALLSIKVPTQWILGGSDREAPSENTLQILQSIQSKVPHLDIALYPRADHGMIEYSEGGGPGKKSGKPLRFSEGYFPMLIDWIKLRQTRCQVSDVQIFIK